MGIGLPVGTRLILATRRLVSSSSWIWPGQAQREGTPTMNPVVRTGIEIAALVSAVVTVIFVVVVRLFFRREKSLREP